MEFHKVRPTKASTAVAQQLLRAIKEGVFPVDSKLPSEAELAQMMGVSRPTVREALSALAAVGLIEARPGIGNFVKNPTESMAFEALFLLESEASCLEIMEARTVLEPAVAELAAKKRTPEQAELLFAICEELEGLATPARFDEYFTADKRFHLALVQATGNSLLAAALTPLINTMDQRIYREFTREYYMKDVESITEVASLHRRVAEAVAQKDGAGARQAMHAHWLRMWRLVQGEETPA
ncbi:MAG: FadR family transcriptional regulator [Candidatus Bipolaricaulota bacterium]|nr:FadR family transcriptional regulator [Candidatus Bipolaricaulota bacterium]MDW8151685.1 FadR/GntR family transcriptional regulator [Candidatus Bipolaricaulota bacterium]